MGKQAGVRSKKLLSRLAVAVAVGAPVLLFAGTAQAVSYVVPVSNTFNLNQIACTSANSCWVAGYSGQGVLLPVSHGIPGTPISTNPVSGNMFAIACPSSTACYAVGTDDDVSNPPENSEGMVVPILNGVVEPAILVRGTNDLYGITCYTSTQCLAVGDEVFSLTEAPYQYGVTVLLDAGSPGSATQVPSTGYLFGAACQSSAGDCIAVGLTINETTDDYEAGVVAVDSGVPAAAQAIPALAGLTKAACVSSSQCYGVGADGVVSIVNQTPGTLTVDSKVTDYYNLTCTSATVCQLVGQSAKSIAFIQPLTKGTPGALTNFAGTSYFNGVTCPSATECVAAGAEPFNGDFQGILVTGATAAPKPKITKVKFSGPKINPTVTLTGSSFGAWAPPGTLVGCNTGDTGDDYGASGLNVGDTTDGWGAGTDGDCIGLIVSSWTNSKIVLTFGNEYSIYPTIAVGDTYQVEVSGVTVTGTITST